MKTNISALDRTVHKTDEWLKEISQELGWDDKERSYVALRAVLLTLRDRLSPEQAAHLAAQLPMLVRGIFYEGYHPAGKPERIRSREEFANRIQAAFEPHPGHHPEEIARAVFAVLRRHVTEGELNKVLHELPDEIEAIFKAPASS